MAGEGTKVGEVYVEIKAQGAENVAKEVQKAQQMASAPGGFTQLPAWAGSAGANSTMTDGGGPAAQIKAIGEAATAAAPAIGNASDKVQTLKERLKSTVQGLSDARQGIAAVASATLGWISTLTLVALPITMVINYLHEKRKATLEASKAIGDLNEGWQDYIRSINDPAFDATESKLNEINKRLNEQKKSLDEQGQKAGWSNQRIAAEQRAAEEEAQQARDKVRADYEEKARQRKATEEKKAYEKLQAETIAMEVAAEDEEASAIDRLNNERFRKHAELIAKQEATDDEAEKRQYQRQIEAVDRIYDKKVEAEQRAQGERERSEKEAADRQIKQAEESARRQAQAIGEAYTKATEDIMANFANQQSQSIEELAQYVKLIAEGVGR